jgi:hypothetical protein
MLTRCTYEVCAFWDLDLAPIPYGWSLHLAVVGADELVRVSVRFRQGKTSDTIVRKRKHMQLLNSKMDEQEAHEELQETHEELQ